MSETQSLQRREYLAAAPAIDEEQQKRLNEAEEQEKAISLQRMTQKKAWTFQNSRPDLARSHDRFTHTLR